MDQNTFNIIMNILFDFFNKLVEYGVPTVVGGVLVWVGTLIANKLNHKNNKEVLLAVEQVKQTFQEGQAEIQRAFEKEKSAINAKLDNSKAVFRVQFEKEFEIYLTLNESLTKIIYLVSRLFTCYETPNIDQKIIMERKHSLTDHLIEHTRILNSYTFVIDLDIHQEITRFHLKVIHQIVDDLFNTSYYDCYYEKIDIKNAEIRKEYIDNLRQMLKEVIMLMKERINSLQVID